MRMFSYYKNSLSNAKNIREVANTIGFAIFNEQYLYVENVSDSSELIK